MTKRILFFAPLLCLMSCTCRQSAVVSDVESLCSASNCNLIVAESNDRCDSSDVFECDFEAVMTIYNDSDVCMADIERFLDAFNEECLSVNVEFGEFANEALHKLNRFHHIELAKALASFSDSAKQTLIMQELQNPVADSFSWE